MTVNARFNVTRCCYVHFFFLRRVGWRRKKGKKRKRSVELLAGLQYGSAPSINLIFTLRQIRNESMANNRRDCLLWPREAIVRQPTSHQTMIHVSIMIDVYIYPGGSDWISRQLTIRALINAGSMRRPHFVQIKCQRMLSEAQVRASEKERAL